ncbi:MAG: beta-N-acetylhexosaminidase [Chloroflexota bacterium]
MISVIPKPQFVEVGNGRFLLTSQTSIDVSKETAKLGHYLASLIRPSTGYPFPVSSKGDTAKTLANCITLHLTNDFDHPEGYSLFATEHYVRIHVGTQRGLFYGIQTLRQLLPPNIESDTEQKDEAWEITAVTIHDKPRFDWRGVMLDVCRHMFPMEFIKKQLDLMALQKMNTLHLHLTEDQGWRIEIKKYPRLTEIGSIREATPFPSNRNELDGVPYGGFYTQEQLLELCRYAEERFITIVPEIELPGHAVAALASYPHLGCQGKGYKVRTYWGIEEDVYCAGNEETFTFLEDVLSEVLAVFPSHFIHIGGDECPKDRWRACPKCQDRMTQEGLADEYGLQSYFVRRIEQFLNKNGRRLIGWDEILEGGLAPNATVMSWRGAQGGIDAATAGHDVVMTPNTHCYFDYYQSEDTDNEPPAIGGYIPAQNTFLFDPTAGIDPQHWDHVLGGQGNLWTEYINTPEQAEYMLYPRASALAEAVWTANDVRDFDEFNGRLQMLYQRFDHLNINYRTID